MKNRISDIMIGIAITGAVIAAFGLILAICITLATYPVTSSITAVVISIIHNRKNK